MVVGFWCKNIDMGKTEVTDKSCSNMRLVTINSTQSVLWSNPSFCGEKPETNCLRYKI